MCNMKVLSLIHIVRKLWTRITFFVHASHADADVDGSAMTLALQIILSILIKKRIRKFKNVSK